MPATGLWAPSTVSQLSVPVPSNRPFNTINFSSGLAHNKPDFHYHLCYYSWQLFGFVSSKLTSYINPEVLSDQTGHSNHFSLDLPITSQLCTTTCHHTYIFVALLQLADHSCNQLSLSGLDNKPALQNNLSPCTLTLRLCPSYRPFSTINCLLTLRSCTIKQAIENHELILWPCSTQASFVLQSVSTHIFGFVPSQQTSFTH